MSHRRVCDAEPVLEATVTAWQPLTESPLFVRWRDCIEHALCKPMIHFIQSTPHLTRYLHWLACSLQSVADVQRRRPRFPPPFIEPPRCLLIHSDVPALRLHSLV